MYCSKCGKQIADQSKFCSHCGAQVYTAPAENRGPVRETYAAQPVKTPKKSNGFLRWVLTAVIASLVFTGVKFITESTLTRKQQTENAGGSGSYLSNTDSNFEEGFKAALAADPDVSDAMDSCFRGAVYQDGYVRYGMTRLYLPDYSLLAGEGDERDWLISPDNALLFAADRQLEIPEVSFGQSSEEGMLNSYKQTYSDASMVDYQKYYVNDFPVIRYVISYTADGIRQYQGELIVFPGETADKTIRLAMFADASSGYGADAFDLVFDSLQVSPEYRVSADDADMVGMNRITVK